MPPANPPSQQSVRQMRADIKRLSADVEALTVSIEALLEIDRSLKLLIKVIKWAAGAVTTAGAMWAAWKAN